MVWRFLRMLRVAMFLGVAGVGQAREDRHDVSYLPDSNRYKAALSVFQRLPEEDREALMDWGTGGPAGGERTELPERLRPTVKEWETLLLHAGRTSDAGLREGDWPLRRNKDDPSSFKTMPVAPLRMACRVTTRIAEERTAAEAMALNLELVRLGRDLQSEGTLTACMLAAVLENASVDAMRLRLGELTAPELETFAETRRTIPERWTPERVFAAEQATYDDSAWEASVSALRALIGEDGKFVSVFDRMQVSGMADPGQQSGKLWLKDRESGKVIALSPEQPTDGFELVSINFEAGEAEVRNGERIALIDLESREIHEERPELAVLRMAFWALGKGPGTDADLRRLGEEAAGAGGPVAYGALCREEHGRVIQEVIALASKAELAPESELPRPHCLLIGGVAGAYYKIVRNLRQCELRSAMLDRAIQLHMEASGAAVVIGPATDPWSEEGGEFGVEEMPGGGFRLRSIFQTEGGTGLACEFPGATTQR